MKFDFSKELDNCISHLNNLMARNTYPELEYKILTLRNKLNVYRDIHKSLTEYKALTEIEAIKTYRTDNIHINGEIIEDNDYMPVWQTLQEIKMSLMMACVDPDTRTGKRIINNSSKFNEYLRMTGVI